MTESVLPGLMVVGAMAVLMLGGHSLAELHDDEGIAGDCLKTHVSDQPNGLARVVACYLNPSNEGPTAARWWIANDVRGNPYLSYVWVCVETVAIESRNGEPQLHCRRDRKYALADSGELIGYTERELLPVQRVLKDLRWDASDAPEEYQDYPQPPEIAATVP